MEQCTVQQELRYSYNGEYLDRCNGVALSYTIDLDSSLNEWSVGRDPPVDETGSVIPVNEFLWVDGNFTSQQNQAESNGQGHLAIEDNGNSLLSSFVVLEFSSMPEDLMEELMSEEEPGRTQGFSDHDTGVMSNEPEKVWSAENNSTGSTNCLSSDNKGVLIIYLLTTCAEAISDGSHDLADILLRRLREMVCATGSTMERVAFYLSRALRQRHQLSSAGHPMEVSLKPQYLRDGGSLSLLNQVFPFIRIPHFTANQSILEALTKGERKTIHIIDFDIMEGMQWPPLMEALKSGGYEIDQLKISALKWDCGDDANNLVPLCTITRTGRMLSEYADSVGIPFSFEETALENMKRDNDEVVAVNCMWELPHMRERSRTQLLNFIHRARQLDPVVLTVGTGAPDEPHEKLNLLESFNECLRNLCAFFDCSEAALPERYALARAKVEYLFLAPMVCRPLNYTGQLGLMKVLDIPPKCGFVQGEISKKNLMYVNEMVVHLGFPMQYRVNCVGTQQLLLQWHSTILSRISIWKPITYSKDSIPAVYLWQ